MNLKNGFIKKIIILNLIIFFIGVLLTANIHAEEVIDAKIDSFDVLLDIKSPNNAKITEKWKFNFDSQEDLEIFKDKIFSANINISKLKEINPQLEPHVFINEFKQVKIGFDEVENIVRIEYTIDDLCLIQYLDYDNEIIWKLNENLFRHFVTNNLYDIPKNSYLRVKLYDPLIIGESLPPFDNTKEGIVSWTGVSSNELRLIAIEKKPPKPSFVILDLLNDEQNFKVYIFSAFILILIIMILLIFKDKISKKIKLFVVKHSKLNTKKTNQEIINSQYFNK